MTVEYLLENISSRELTEWMSYYQIEPFGEEREDLRMGIISSTIANVNKGKNGKTYKPKDFIPNFNKPTQTWQEQLKAIELLNIAFKGEDRRKNK